MYLITFFYRFGLDFDPYRYYFRFFEDFYAELKFKGSRGPGFKGKRKDANQCPRPLHEEIRGAKGIVSENYALCFTLEPLNPF